MATFRCPGQNTQNWRFEDIFEAQCPNCRIVLEFWKDEPTLICKGCGGEVRNPRMDLGCAKWCKFADKCLGVEVQTKIASKAPPAAKPAP